MNMEMVDEFNEYRERMNAKILAADNLLLKRIYNLDSNAFGDGNLDARTKEFLGLACSLVLRCDDCVKYHLGKCFDLGISKNEVIEAMSISNLIGGTIVIPHLRRAVEFWEELERKNVSERP